MSSALLADLVAAAAQELQADVGGPSSCALAKAGRPVGGRKAAEGRWAALREVQRRVEAGESALLVASERLPVWTAELDRHRAGGSSADWVTYRAGGVAALTDLVRSAGGAFVAEASV